MVVVIPGKYEHRNIFYFRCTLCGKKRRQSLKEKKARDGVCSKCLRGEGGVDPRQTSLLPKELNTAASNLLSLSITKGQK